ncbi:hypothetical protein [Micromonospora noduli]|uniref:Uncharacterized protein n=1 Tax=Micromonospora noduli TaxID=709876 RepID=A0A328N8E6_9ACTN|nr:hypothetical protein [Micromonospora noduli]KAB1927855.1 hypothetical protein F8280_05125 [Micromonospora noduli]RAO01242.1 hypothetical protein LAH08_02877 [Micromonospora noduli]RAO06612.1 hypothetical protein GUI43_04739 [Micromonospora noduli]RAO25463.1 hypothetical protein ONO23_05976 [Micromonospora noduli]
MSEPKTNRIPAPIYAAAGAGELAIEQLRKLPAVVGVLSTRVVADLGGRAVLTGFELKQKATETLRTANETADLAKLREVADIDKLRAAATRNAALVVAGAQVAQERAFAAYGALVARGERVVGAGVLEAAETVNADIEATEAVTPATTAAATTPTVAAPADAPTPADVAEIAEAKPAAVKKVARAPKAAKPAVTPSAKLPRATKRTRPAAE